MKGIDLIDRMVSFRKPGRYIGNEWNVAKKKITQDTVKVCVCFPDVYELGMSNLGMQILYGYFNLFDNVVCDRVFLPAEDYQSYLTGNNAPLRSIDYGFELASFDMIGFLLNYELNAVHMLRILQLGKIRINAQERLKPIVGIGGCANPLSVSKFIDFCFFGEVEADSGFSELISRIPKMAKHEFLDELSKLRGVYVPGKTKSPVSKVFVRNLNDSFYPRRWIVPYVSIVHDRAYIEIARGCPNACAFCQARCMYFPYRERDPEKVIELAHSVYRKTGYDDFSLLALSVSDYSHIEYVVKELRDSLGRKGVKISLPSLRATDLFGKLSKIISHIKKTSLTIAVETASSRLRKRMNKDIDNARLFSSLEMAAGAGYRKFKFYFMIGLAHEEQEDIEELICFIYKVQSFIGKRSRNSMLNVNISFFIPKPYTLFENERMNALEDMIRKKRYIFDKLRRCRNIKIHIASPFESVIEGVLSRADNRLSDVLKTILSLKSNFSQGNIDFSLWEHAFKENNLEYGEYVYQEKTSHAWDIFKPMFIR